MRWGLRAGLAGVFLMVALGASQADAQSDRERAAARQAAKEGISAFQQQRWEDALKYLERAESVVHAPTHLLFIARANVKMGKFIEAREAYNKLINENLESNAPRAFHNAQDAGREEIKELDGRLGKVSVEVVGPDGVELEGLELTVEDEVIPPALIDLPIPTNPGEHLIRATADGMLPAEETVSVEEGGSASVTLTLKPDPNATVAAAPPPEETPEPEPKEPTAPAPAEKQGNPQKTWGWVSIGTGVALGGVGAAMWLISDGKLNEVSGDSDLCLEQNCREDGIDQINQAQTMALIGDVSIAVGVGAIGLGTILLATAKKKPQAEVGVTQVIPAAGKNGGYLLVRGGF